MKIGRSNGGSSFTLVIRWVVPPLLATLLCVPALAQERRTFAVPFHDVGRLILLDMKVNGKPAVVLFDTGANVSLFRHAEALGGVTIELAPKELVGLAALDLDRAGIVSLKLAKDFPRVDGILGEDFLRGFSAVRIDYKRRVVEFEK